MEVLSTCFASPRFSVLEWVHYKFVKMCTCWFVWCWLLVDWKWSVTLVTAKMWNLLLVCAYARAWAERIIVFLQFKIPPCKTLYRGCTNLSVDDSKCSSKNDPSFYEKWAVVLWKVTRRFTKKMLVLFSNRVIRYNESPMHSPKAICFPFLSGVSKAQYAKKDFSTDE